MIRAKGILRACAACTGAVLLAAPLLAAPPVTISPGSAAGELITASCPTFSWVLAGGDDGVELVVYGLGPDGELAPEPTIALRLPAGAQVWTPAAGECLAGGSSYAWLVRPLGPEGAGDWSEPAVFEVALPSRAEVAEALSTLRRCLDGRSDLSVAAEAITDGLPEGGPEPPAPNEPPAPENSEPVLPFPELDQELRVGLTERSHTSGSAAIHAVEPATSGHSYGVWGESRSTIGVGVVGMASATSQSATGVRGVSYATQGRGVSGWAEASRGVAMGVHGASDSTQGIGVRGLAVATSGVATGVQGWSNSPDGRGVVGWASATSGSARGVWGWSSSTEGYAVLGKAAATSGSNFGVFGQTDSSQGYGVFGWASATNGTTYGVYGKANSPFGWAGYFLGSVNVTGTLWKAAGSFRIDHPLDPANRTLSHSFVESPDMMNVYNGNVVLGIDGAAWVELPEYFEALNREFRYQLTALDRPAPRLYVAERIAANRFRIAGGEPATEVSWQVTGVRQDAYARKHPIVVEEEKGELAGRYIHPEAHGQPVELAIHRQPEVPEPGEREPRGVPLGPTLGAEHEVVAGGVSGAGETAPPAPLK